MAAIGTGDAACDALSPAWWLGPAVAGLDATDQPAIDQRLRETDGSADLGRLGANGVLAVSVATALAAADASGVPLWRRLTREAVLPLPMVKHRVWRRPCRRRDRHPGRPGGPGRCPVLRGGDRARMARPSRRHDGGVTDRFSDAALEAVEVGSTTRAERTAKWN